MYYYAMYICVDKFYMHNYNYSLQHTVTPLRTILAVYVKEVEIQVKLIPPNTHYDIVLMASLLGKLFVTLKR